MKFTLFFLIPQKRLVVHFKKKEKRLVVQTNNYIYILFRAIKFGALSLSSTWLNCINKQI